MNWPCFILISFLLSACKKPVSVEHILAPPESPTSTQEAAPKRTIDEASQIAALINPSKLATLKSRGANPRILKITAILYTAKTEGKNTAEIANEAVIEIGWGDTDKGSLTAAGIRRNLAIAEEFGSITPEDITEMRKGQSPTVRRGPHAGNVLSVDHIIPRAVVPELDNVICNLELMPLRANQSKGDDIGNRQRDLARQLHACGLLKSPNIPQK